MTSHPNPNTELKDKLKPHEYEVTQNAGTEAPFGENYEQFLNQKDGAYHCLVCDTKLFASVSKFNSHCGWPSFWDCIPGTIQELEDRSLAPRIRTEVRCAKCGAHLGHVFNEDHGNPKNLRYCINAVSITHATPTGAKEKFEKFDKYE